jgi:hypothetical protein
LLPDPVSGFIVDWLYNGAGASVVIAGLFPRDAQRDGEPTGSQRGRLRHAAN